MEIKLSKALDRLGTESAFTILAEAKKLEAVSYTHLTLPTKRIV